MSKFYTAKLVARFILADGTYESREHNEDVTDTINEAVAGLTDAFEIECALASIGEDTTESISARLDWESQASFVCWIEVTVVAE